jgi:hypothetical protein
VSLDATRWVWSQQARVPSNTALLVLLCLADMADKCGASWASQSTIGKRTRLAPRTVRKSLAALQKANLIRREARFLETGRTSDLVYVLHPLRRQPSVADKKGKAEQQPPTSGHSEIAENDATALEADPDAGTSRQDEPLPPGTSCQESNQTEPTRYNQEVEQQPPALLLLMPDSGRPDIDTHNYAVSCLEMLQPILMDAVDWSSPGIKSFEKLYRPFAEYNFYFIAAQMTIVVERWRRSGGTRIKSWKYFQEEIDRQAQSDRSGAKGDPNGTWKAKVEAQLEARKP